MQITKKEREREFCFAFLFFALLCFGLLLYFFFSTERVLRDRERGQRKTKRMGGFILVKNVALYLNGPVFLHYYTSTRFLFIANLPLLLHWLNEYGVVLGNPTCQLPLSDRNALLIILFIIIMDYF